MKEKRYFAFLVHIFNSQNDYNHSSKKTKYSNLELLRKPGGLSTLIFLFYLFSSVIYLKNAEFLLK